MRVENQGKRAAESAGEQADSRIRTVTMTLIACLIVPLVGIGCLGGISANPLDPAMQDATFRAARIEALQNDIERDHRTLEALISQPGQAADTSLHEHPELRAIATRLTEQERRLETLLAMDANDTVPRNDTK